MAVTDTTTVHTTNTNTGVVAGQSLNIAAGGLGVALGAGVGAQATSVGSAASTTATDERPVADILADYGLTVEQAHDFYVANLNAPQTIYDATEQYGLSFANVGTIAGLSTQEVQDYFVQADLGATTTALASIGLTGQEATADVNAALDAGAVQQVFDITGALDLDIDALAEVSGTWSVDQLQNAFVIAGLDPADLGGAPADEVGTALLPPAQADGVASLLTFNANDGALGTEALREAVLDLGVSQEAYDAHFDATGYVGAADGTLSPEDIGTDAVGAFEATGANIESLFYGTTVAGLQAFDQIEWSRLDDFVTDNSEALHAGDAAAINAYADLVVSAAATPTDAPALSGDELIAAVVETTAAAIGLAGDGGHASVFDPTQFIPTAA